MASPFDQTHWSKSVDQRSQPVTPTDTCCSSEFSLWMDKFCRLNALLLASSSDTFRDFLHLSHLILFVLQLISIFCNLLWWSFCFVYKAHHKSFSLSLFHLKKETHKTSEELWAYFYSETTNNAKNSNLVYFKFLQWGQNVQCTVCHRCLRSHGQMYHNALMSSADQKLMDKSISESLK